MTIPKSNFANCPERTECNSERARNLERRNLLLRIGDLMAEARRAAR